MNSSATKPPSARTTAVVGGFVLPLLLVAVVVASLAVGAGDVGHGFGAVWQARGDRTVVAVLVGAAVALSGTALQGITRNPLADPGILGVNAGASLSVVLGITFLGLNTPLGYFAFALAGALVAAVAVAVLAQAAARQFGGSGSAGAMSVALAGMVFTAAATAIASAVLVANSKSLEVYRYWQVGSVGGRSLADVAWVMPLFAAGFVGALASGRRLDVLSMGDSVARGLGESPVRLRAVIGFFALLLAAAAVAVAGPVAFVGLLAPHMLRPILGTSYRTLLPAAAVVGAIVVVAADTLGRVIMPPSEVQVGIMTAVVGCPALLWVISRVRAR